jgi:hypothetical protein
MSGLKHSSQRIYRFNPADGNTPFSHEKEEEKKGDEERR